MYTFESLRLQYKPKIPNQLKHLLGLQAKPVYCPEKIPTELKTLFPKSYNFPLIEFEFTDVKKKFPLKVGVVFSGGPAPGGNNVLAGIFDAIKKFQPNSQLIGFLDGPDGLLKRKTRNIFQEDIAQIKNLGGFDFLSTGRGKIETIEQKEVALKIVEDLSLDGLIIIGGDDSNTNAAALAEFFLEKGCKTKVIGVPKTIDGDLKNQYIEISFGFDTASKTYAHTIGSLLKDALSQKKYYFFVKLMGRSASHIALECALATHPTYTLISEEIKEEKQNLRDVVVLLSDIICHRAKENKNYGLFLIPEGSIEFFNDVQTLIREINNYPKENLTQVIKNHLSKEAKTLFEDLPQEIQKQFLLERDPHGNVQVTKIETERLILELVQKELKKRKEEGSYQGSFSPQAIFLGYEGRSAMPSNFDANYCYALGLTAALLIKHGLTGYMAGITHLNEPVEAWTPIGLPLISMMGFENRQGKEKAVIKKALVDLKGAAFDLYKEWRLKWAYEDHFQFPPPIQFFGPHEFSDQLPLTLKLDAMKTNEYRYVM
ncbi:diphosphate--fructose-6-phosphate 1-phosphotransferase [Criblamydia sequanensis]|uniref:Pyrophosphate--fructose 6-phosphate 1-phosphotransferase n=1 Tax=Candidatus Criblamydia sequanensis CRIB-18 TaxID=1437425 RepID=A0A090CYI0_9BACT|nr:diphosphate--fructose-6-phosphate 1-phosphotransferase [Criblamydia sequanensis]CDR33617.1 Pyrophosphate--fructose 6-phosphate 1-phosphotransferase [Criblamydia sequanensis CRIB-18]